MSKELTTGFFPERFTVSAEGMSDLSRDRFEGLIYELVQNVFDEDTATFAAVSVYYYTGKGVRVVVKDDGDGYANPRDMYEIFGPNPKRGMAEKRGRFNWGQQKVLSVATEAKVTTVGYTVEFPSTGGRIVRRNRREKGTEVVAVMPWSMNDAETLRQRLRLIRPPECCSFRINGREVTHPAPVKIHETTLDTVIQREPGEPMRRTRRKTRIEILTPAAPDGKGWLYEMGLPVQEIDAPYDVNVLQKVPLNPNRDTVRESYLQDIYSELLNAMHDDMRRDEFGETWVRTAVEDGRLSEDAARTTVERRYGRKAVIWSSDRNANIEAMDKGYQVVHPRTMSREERSNLRDLGGMESASARFGKSLGGEQDPQLKVVDVSGDPVKLAFAEWVKELGGHVGVAVLPVFIHNPRSFALADCTRSSARPTMRFNLARLKDEFFEGREKEQLALVIHELGHALSPSEFSHGYSWGDACADAGAMIALELAERTRPD